MFRTAPLHRPSKIAWLSVTAVLGALVAGCTMGWVRPNTTAEQTRNDNVECQISAAGDYPPSVIKAGSQAWGTFNRHGRQRTLAGRRNEVLYASEGIYLRASALMDGPPDNRWR